jgi:hypothetical protein
LLLQEILNQRSIVLAHAFHRVEKLGLRSRAGELVDAIDEPRSMPDPRRGA